MLKEAWARYRFAKTRQRELAKAFAGIGVNYFHLDTTFTRHALKEAMETDAATVFDKYSPLIRSVVAFEGNVVTPEFNRRLVARFLPILEDVSSPSS